jgi:hypothetical protein
VRRETPFAARFSTGREITVRFVRRALLPVSVPATGNVPVLRQLFLERSLAFRGQVDIIFTRVEIAKAVRVETAENLDAAAVPASENFSGRTIEIDGREID